MERPFTRDQRRKVPVHRLVADAEDVRDATDIGEGRVASPRQLDGQRLGGIERSPGKRPEAGDQDRGGHPSCLNAGRLSDERRPDFDHTSYRGLERAMRRCQRAELDAQRGCNLVDCDRR